MSDFPRSLLAASICAALFIPYSYAETAPQSNTVTIGQCRAGDIEPTNQNEQPINVEADKLEAVNGDKATYVGNVVVVQGKKRMSADTVTLHQKDNIVVAQGNVKFDDGEVQAVSERATNNLNTDQLTLEKTNYHFLCQPGRGDAVYVAKTGQAMYEIEDGSITSCPDGDNAWRLKASSISIDQNEETATFYNPRMEVLGVPLFYLPLLQVPIGDTRKTGFLYPTFSFGSKDGFQLNVPIYWNLAPNYDLQTDLKYMENRGTQLNSHFRYLNTFGRGDITYEYLPDDKKYPEKDDRWGFQLTHYGIYDQSWALAVNYAEVSDIDYFSDLGSEIGTRQDGQLTQEASVSYRSANWDLSLLTRDFQILTTTGNQPYKLMPQVAFNYYAPELMRYLDFDLISHVSRFDTDENGAPSATRVHIEPGIKIPLGATWGTWTTEARLLSTYYQQDLDNVDPSKGYKENVSRDIPEFRSNLGLILERDTVVLDGYTQTLEPQVQYLYIPKRDQSDIARYDTTLLQTDYYGLFRSRKYSSVDFVAPANQISYGAASRFFDDQYKERLNIAFGQIFYLDKGLKNNLNNSTTENSDYSAWAVEMDFNYDDALFYHGGIQYDVDTSRVQLSNSTLEYRHDKGFIQTNYRYVTQDYIEDTVGDTLDVNSLTKDGISQLGVVAQYNLTPKWQTKALYYYDLTTDNPLEWQANLTYLSDCWFIGLTYSRELDKWTPSFQQYPDAEARYESNLSVNIGIIGLGTNMTHNNELQSNAIGYGRPFVLSN
ncbi:LPS-assembly protein LptD precursor [Vibrio ruber DSM 16370]|uniref:LPS-assembly protein LptD n=1 Tax=Vibrio ruber (strain DSM 16370 / JCM 11486 / BCRC 17186 / CECT 7878 / LMG 23124 / VR1) TaxID=1123498 RepID=A0A1R4LST1_VIBR1|nr:LPS assembly protein LptD [Vibrio ruber]SJN59513.1 LPS-assembly protein LptD precursor [Vibrio ruber DSM 16370]